MNLSAHDLQFMQRGGLLHDIGRLGMLSAYPEYPILLASARGSTQELLEHERKSFSVPLRSRSVADPDLGSA